MATEITAKKKWIEETNKIKHRKKSEHGQKMHSSRSEYCSDQNELGYFSTRLVPHSNHAKHTIIMVINVMQTSSHTATSSANSERGRERVCVFAIVPFEKLKINGEEKRPKNTKSARELFVFEAGQSSNYLSIIPIHDFRSGCCRFICSHTQQHFVRSLSFSFVRSTPFAMRRLSQHNARKINRKELPILNAKQNWERFQEIFKLHEIRRQQHKHTLTHSLARSPMNSTRSRMIQLKAVASFLLLTHIKHVQHTNKCY